MAQTFEQYVKAQVENVIEVESYRGFNRKLGGMYLVNKVGCEDYLNADTRIFRKYEDIVCGAGDFVLTAVFEDGNLYVELS